MLKEFEAAFGGALPLRARVCGLGREGGREGERELFCHVPSQLAVVVVVVWDFLNTLPRTPFHVRLTVKLGQLESSPESSKIF